MIVAHLRCGPPIAGLNKNKQAPKKINEKRHDMSTRSIIAFANENGTLDAVYCHYDGYPEYMYPTITNLLETKGSAYLKLMIVRAQTEGGIRTISPMEVETFGEKSNPSEWSYTREQIESGDFGPCECVYIVDQSNTIVEFHGHDQHMQSMKRLLTLESVA